MLPDAIDFSGIIAREAAGFVGRDWVLGAIGRWLTSGSDDRFFLITGAPGAGKTALSARLASGWSTAVGAHHFCNARDASWNSPFAFSRSIAAQLARRFADYPLAIGEGAVRPVRIDIRQDVTGGDAVAIGALTLEMGEMTAREAFARLCLAPLERLARARPDQQIVVLVDGLDESLAFGGDASIASLLAEAGDLPRNVRFILTSREHTELELHFGGAALRLSSSEHHGQNREDLGAFVDASLDSSQAPPDELARFRQALVEQGNFLFARLALRMGQTAGIAGDELTVLPDGLAPLIAEWLGRLLRLKSKDWVSDYAPIFGALSVARESMATSTLAVVTGQDGARLRGNLADLREFVTADLERGGGEFAYALFHDALREFLQLDRLTLRGSALPNRYHLDALEQHERVAASFRGKAARWRDLPWAALDGYACRHLAAHLASLADRPGYERAVFEVVCADLRREQRRRFDSDDAFIQDVRLAIRVARDRRPKDLDAWLRGVLIIGGLRDSIDLASPLVIGALALAGYADLADSLADLRSNPADYLYIAEAALVRKDQPRARAALDRVLQSDPTDIEEFPLGEILKMLTAAGQGPKCLALIRSLLAGRRILGRIDPDVFEEIASHCVAIGDLSELETAIDTLPAQPVFLGGPPQMPQVFQALHELQVAEALLDAGHPDHAITAVETSLAIERSSGHRNDEVRIKAADLLFRLDRSVKARRLIESLGRASRAAFHAMRRAANGAPGPMFEQAGRDHDGELFAQAIGRALALAWAGEAGMLDLAICQAKSWKDDTRRWNAFGRIAEIAAACGRWEKAVDGIEEAGPIPRISWRLLATVLANLPPDDFTTAADHVRARASRLDDRGCAAGLEAVCAYALARRGRAEEALASVRGLLEDARQRAGGDHGWRILSRIAVLLDDAGRAEGAWIADTLATRSRTTPGARMAALVGGSPEESLSRLREWVRNTDMTSGDLSGLIAEYGMGETGETIDALQAQLAPHARSGAPRQPAVPPALFQKAMAQAASPLDKLTILENDGAAAAVSLGPSAVIDAALAIGLPLFQHGSITTVARDLARLGAADTALAFIIEHLERSGTLLGRSNFFHQLEEDLPILRELGAGDPLWRVAETIVEFGF